MRRSLWSKFCFAKCSKVEPRENTCIEFKMSTYNLMELSSVGVHYALMEAVAMTRKPSNDRPSGIELSELEKQNRFDQCSVSLKKRYRPLPWLRLLLGSVLNPWYSGLREGTFLVMVCSPYKDRTTLFKVSAKTWADKPMWTCELEIF